MHGIHYSGDIDIYYWNGTEFVEVTYTSAHGFSIPVIASETIEVTFDAFTSSKIKITIHQHSTDGYRNFGLAEWKINGKIAGSTSITPASLVPVSDYYVLAVDSSTGVPDTDSVNALLNTIGTSYTNAADKGSVLSSHERMFAPEGARAIDTFALTNAFDSTSGTQGGPITSDGVYTVYLAVKDANNVYHLESSASHLSDTITPVAASIEVTKAMDNRMNVLSSSVSSASNIPLSKYYVFSVDASSSPSDADVEVVCCDQTDGKFT